MVAFRAFKSLSKAIVKELDSLDLFESFSKDEVLDVEEA